MSTRAVAAAALLAGALLIAPGCSESPPGEWMIVFPAARDGEWSLYVVDQEGGQPVRIAETAAPGWWPPVPSPDGRKIVLPVDDLVVMNSDGRGRVRLAAGGSAVWSPDSKQIVFDGGASGLSIIGADGKDRRDLTHGSSDYQTDYDAAWSPDGKRIAFARHEIGVMLVDSDGTDTRMLWPSRRHVGELHWSRDGRSLTFVQSDRLDTDVVETTDLVTISVSDRRLLNRVPLVDLGGRITWSPDGDRLAYTPYKSRGSDQIVVMRPDGSVRRTIAEGWDPIWSPDGRTIAYLGFEASRGYHLRSISPDGTGMRRLTSTYPNGVEPRPPSWMRGPVTPAPSPYQLVESRRPKGAALKVQFPVAELAASGSRVALVSTHRVWAPSAITTPPIVVWDAKRGGTFRLSLATCDQPQSLAVLDDRIAVECPWAEFGISGKILVFPGAGVRPFELANGYVGEGPPQGSVPGRIAGRSDLLVFATYRFSSSEDDSPQPQLWRANRRSKALVVTGSEAGGPAAVDRGRIAVERSDGQVVLLHRDGRVLGRIAPGGRPPSLELYELDAPTVGLSGHDLVVLRDGRLGAYDTDSFGLRRSWRVNRRSKLAGVSDGLVAYVVGADVHILRLRDGRSTTIRTTSRNPVKASITSSGLFYVLHARRFPKYRLPPFRPNPATVVYLRRSEIARRLG